MEIKTIYANSSKYGSNFELRYYTSDQIDYAYKCLEYLDNLPIDINEHFKECLMKYYNEHKDYVELSITKDTVLNHIELTELTIGKNWNKEIIEFSAAGWCEWEEEHGIEVVFSDGKILYLNHFIDVEPNSRRLEYILQN